jgi:hypothetical protein
LNDANKIIIDKINIYSMMEDVCALEASAKPPVRIDEDNVTA